MIKWIKARYELLMYGSDDKMTTKQLVRRIRRGERWGPAFSLTACGTYTPEEAGRQIEEAIKELKSRR